MKKLLLPILMLTLIGGLKAQEKRINLYGAYVFDDKFETYNSSTNYFNGKIKGGFQWGAGLEFKIQETNGVELVYYRQDTQVPINYYNVSATSKNLDIAINYITLGFNKYVPKDKIEPYGGLLAGVAIFNNKKPTAGQETSAVKFAVGFRLGANIWASDRVGIKLQAQFMTAVQGVGGGLYFGTGGAGAGASTYSTITQLGLGGGLVFKLGAQ